MSISVANTPITKKIFNLVYRCLGPVILFYIFWLIGFDQIKETLLGLTLSAILVILLLKILATICRLAKYIIFNRQYSVLQNAEIYLSAKIGGEISIVGHFSPLLNDEFRSAKTVQLLLIDRYLEVYATFIVAFICALFFLGEHYFYWGASIFFAAGLVAASVPFFFRVRWRSRIAIFDRALDLACKLNGYLRENSRLLAVLLALSILSSLLEFMIVKMIFDALDVHVDFPIIPIVWAIGGVVGYLTFLSVGTAEITSLVLFTKLAKISDYSIASMIIVAKVFIALSSLCVYLLIQLLKLAAHFWQSEWLFGKGPESLTKVSVNHQS
ncbi:MAG TPA: hypothetical protein VGE32_01795 [Cellvibrio sp.]